MRGFFAQYKKQETKILQKFYKKKVKMVIEYSIAF